MFVVLDDEAMAGAETHGRKPSFFSRGTTSRRYIGRLWVVIGRRTPERIMLHWHFFCNTALQI